MANNLQQHANSMGTLLHDLDALSLKDGTTREHKTLSFDPITSDIEHLLNTNIKEDRKKKAFNFPLFLAISIFVSFLLGSIFGILWGKRQMDASYAGAIQQMESLLLKMETSGFGPNGRMPEKQQIIESLSLPSEENLLAPKNSI